MFPLSSNLPGKRIGHDGSLLFLIRLGGPLCQSREGGEDQLQQRCSKCPGAAGIISGLLDLCVWILYHRV
jgi:hypothetical protein